MDFWSRLIGGSRASAKTLRTTSPTERLAAFKRTCNALQQIWRSSNATPGDHAATLHTRSCIDRLNAVLSDESRGPAPHPCLASASTSQIYVTVTKLALSAHDDDILRAAAVFFNTLIDAELDGVVDSRLFARALVDLVRRADTRAEDVETRLVELLFGVSNNIRLQPTILPAWFTPRLAGVSETDATKTTESSNTVVKEFAGATRRDEFPLFYLLVDYVHHEGRAGDFARTGLLYLIETASRSKPLERWLIESDLATLMATGLGALYSQLGSLSFEPHDENLPTVVALSDQQQDVSLHPRLGRAMDSFLSYLLFWQDTIDHCKSLEVNGTLLDHFQILFLQQLLYPSLLESSDVEGGSTSAVLTYLYRILESIDQADLIQQILQYLLASPAHPHATHPDMSVSRRKSLNALTAFAEEAAKPSPSLFNLRDLVLLGLESSNRQTILATLRLLTVILQRHHAFTRSLVRTVPGPPPRPRTVGALNAELRQLFQLATSLVVEDATLDSSYDTYLKDAAWTLESRLCLPSSSDDVAEYPLELRRTDPIFRELLAHLETFFTNSVVVNLALTEVLGSIASSHLVSLDGWILVDPAKYQTASSIDGEEQGVVISRPSTPGGVDLAPDPASMLDQIQRAYEEPTWASRDTPVLTAILHRLVQDVEQWRQEIPDFDILIAARRALLQGSSPALSETTQSAPESTTSPRGRRSDATMSSPPRSYDQDSYDSDPPSRSSSPSPSLAAEQLRRRLAAPFPVRASPKTVAEQAVSDGTSVTASLGHVLTNVAILYEFLLELAALVQIRGGLFEEVDM
ncbi:hypothetical protein ASPZODRAFT_132298 [Penicilliopsis zonata CBS 506.65]|uniref:DNA polymerase epsilon subunit C n=1 Tax=Penicilliopsis zonata CBS 506.65 TaxID=1073090 RepID=A0A1L9SJH0_9EURO|nr:hypothetical protein ASPZODRAFT_132298 [Penicilliopsis zonata CBS 506.65]OJJ47307.1 hypothetical protein ASPZODRAFT_132298 [Penicilliopsis zonata CBS 506.65]